MDRGLGQNPETAEGGAGRTQVGQHRPHNGTGVRSTGAHRQAVPLEVDIPRCRYHNHLDSAIVSSEWTAEEEQVLYEMH